MLGLMLVLSLLLQGTVSTRKPASVSSAKKSAYSVSEKEINSYFHKSGIIGNSVGLGLKYYFNTKPKGYLGSPVMLVYGCYSFYNDFSSNTKYMIHYKGKPLHAWDAVKKSHVKHVFINMGINDFNTSCRNIYSHYTKYLKKIRKANPNVDIIILSTTPARREHGYLTNKNIDKLNAFAQKYVKNHRDMYYVDICSPLRGSDRRLMAKYTSDGDVHLTFAAYAIWVKRMKSFVKSLLKQQKKAKALVKTAGKKLTRKKYNKAKKYVKKLHSGKLKTSLNKKLKKILKKIRKKEDAARKKNTPTPTPTKAPTPTPTPTAEPTQSPTPTPIAT